MKMMGRLLPYVCAGVVLALAPAAAADTARIVSGGPSAKAAKAKALSSVARVQRQLAVCWQGKRPPAVRVELAVDARGAVTRSTKKTNGAAAQCAAGVLAVQKLAGTGRRYKMVVELPTSARSAEADIGSQLEVHRGTLQACYDRVAAKDPKVAGDVALRFLIEADGRIVDPEIVKSSLANKTVERCLLSTMRAARLAARPGGKTVGYSFSMAFKKQSQAGGGATGSSAKLRPRKDGPLAAAVLSRVMNENRSKFTACYNKEVKRTPGLEGTIMIRFTIRGNGTVRGVKVRKSDMGNKRVEACMVAVGKKLVFPGEQGRKNTRVFYPFRFSRR